MSVEAIIEKILNDAEKKGRAIDKETNKTVKRIEKELAEALENLETRYRQQTEEIKNKNQEKVISGAETQTKRAIETEKREQLNSVLKETRNKLQTLPSEQYSSLLTQLLKKLPLSSMYDLTVDVPTERLEESRKAFKQLGLDAVELKTDPTFTGGAIINEKNFRYDLRFEHLLDQIQERSETQIAHLLFAEQK